MATPSPWTAGGSHAEQNFAEGVVMKISRLLKGLLGGLLLSAAMAQAQTFPEKPVRFVNPYAPGGTADVLVQTLGKKLGERWGQPVVVDYKPGAATTIAADFVAKASPDGHTLLLAPAPIVITQYAYAKLPYDSRTAFAPVTLLVSNPLVLVVNPNRIAARSLAEFVQAAKKEPGRLSYGTSGTGGLAHLAVELFRLQSGIDVLHVPYKGGAPAVTDLVGGQIDFMFASPLEVLPYVKAGNLLVLAVSSDKRIQLWPNVPTFKEGGYKDYEAYAWFGVVAPARTPKEVVNKINADIGIALKMPDVVERFTSLGVDIATTSPEDFTRFLAAEHARWSVAVKAANVKMD
jgi:tripartite-type tricarboxylate transporter receptor subunit TctC